MTASLTGFMGCGKSTVAKWLHTSLPGCELVDLDRYIEERDGRRIPQIFAEDGESVFRAMEEQCLREVLSSGKDTILSLGGGTVMTPACFDLIREKTSCFYLRASAEAIRARLLGARSLEDAAKERPLLLGNGIEELLARREPVYEAVAAHVIDTDGRTPADIANEIFYLV